MLILLPVYLLILLMSLHTKMHKLMPVIAGCLFALLTATKVTYPDFSNYEGYYIGVSSGEITIQNTFEPYGWWVICKFLSMFGLTYHGAVVAIVIVSCLALGVSISNCENSGPFWTLYLLVPGVINCVQVKYGVALTVVFCSLIPYLTGKRLGILAVLLGNIVATSIHSSSIVYLILLLAPYVENKSGRDRTIVITSIFAAAILCTVAAPAIAAGFLPAARFERYFGEGAEKASLIWFARIALGYILLLASSHSLSRMKAENLDEQSNIKLFDRVNVCICLLGATLPLLYFDESMHRFIELAFMLLGLQCSYTFAKCGSISEWSRKVVALLVFAGVIGFINYTPIRTVVIPLLSFESFQPLLM